MSQLRKISGLMASFLAENSDSFKRKRLDDDEESDDELIQPTKGVTTKACAKKVPSSPSKFSHMRKAFKKDETPTVETEKVDHSLDYASFFRRVSSFTDSSWCRDVPALSPLEVARHGWFACGELLVRCCSCRENLSLVLPPPDSGVRKQCIASAYTRLTTGHAEFCPWAASSSPMDWTRVHVPEPQCLRTEASRIAEFGHKLPFLKSQIVKEWHLVLAQLQAGERFVDAEEKEIWKISTILALCGWKVGEVPETLCDVYGIRRLGLWNFVSIQEEEDELEARRVAVELGHAVSDERPELPEGKSYLDPVNEHLSWHPMVQPSEKDLLGWQFVIAHFQKIEQRQKLVQSELEEERKKDGGVVLKKVRKIMNQW